jgi:uncharacterized delta-60 repeat protein
VQPLPASNDLLMKSVLPLCFYVALACFSRTEAQPGQWDSSYGTQGVAVFDYELATRRIQESNISLELNDGGLLFATSANRRLTLCKLDANGVVDYSFGHNGVFAIRDLPIWSGGGIQTAELADGKLVVGVGLYDGTGRYLLTRLHANGTLDPTLGINGRVIHPGRYHVTLTDGRMIIVQPKGTVQLTRLLVDGSVDVSFGSDGIRNLPHLGVYDNSYQIPKSRVTGEGAVLLRLVTRAGQNAQQTLVRLKADGTPDILFGTGGAIIRSVAFQSHPAVDDFVAHSSGVLLTRSSEGYVERFSAIGVLQGSSAPLQVNTIEGVNSSGDVVLGINGTGNLRTYQLLDPVTWSALPLSWSTASRNRSALTPLPAGGYIQRSFVSFQSPDRLSKHREDGSLVLTFGDQGRLTPEWHLAADCFRIRLQSSTSEQLSLLFDQGEDTIAYRGGEGYVLTQTGTRAFAQLSPTGSPLSTHVLYERPDSFAANLAPDGSCLIVGNGKVERLMKDGQRSSVKTVGRFPSVNIVSVAESSDGHLLLGGAIARARYKEAVAFRYLPNGPFSVLKFGWANQGQVIDFMPNARGGWITSYAGNIRDFWEEEPRVEDVSILKGFRKVQRLPLSISRISPRRGGTLVARPGVNPLVNFHHSFSNWGQPPTPPSISTDQYSVSLPEFSGEITVTADADGSVVVAGGTATGYALRRITPQGLVDEVFGGQFDSVEGETDLISEVYRGPDGTWWVAGTTKDVAVHRLFVAKHMPEPIVATLLKPDSPVKLDRRTGLMEHEVLVTNHTKASVDVELQISGVMAGVQSIYGAPVVQLSAAEGSRGWKLRVPSVPAGGNKKVKIAYFIPSRRPLVFSPMIKVSAVNANR